MRARIRDTEIYFDVDGSGLVPDGSCLCERLKVFVVHGGPGRDHSPLKIALHPLSKRFQLIYFDHRGQGRSARGDKTKYTLDENVEDMEALRLHLGVGPIVSIGNSYGGMVAMAHAARYPNAVSHLVLVVTAAHSGFVSLARAKVAEMGTPEQVTVFDDLLGGRLDTPERMRRYYEVMGSLYSRKYNPVQARAVLEHAILAAEPLNRALGPDGFLRDFDLRGELRSISARTLVVAGRHDWICPPALSQEIHSLIPGSDLRIFEESSHQIVADEPERLMEAISGFVVYNGSTVAPGPNY
jgi:proline iminopeptidase